MTVNYMPFFGQAQTFFGTTVWDWISGRSAASFNDPIDRLNCGVVPKLFLFFVGNVIGT